MNKYKRTQAKGLMGVRESGLGSDPERWIPKEAIEYII